MRFAEAEGDKVLLVGITGSDEIVAVCHVAAAERDVGQHRLDQLKVSLSDLSMQTALTGYMQDGTSFDVLYFDRVHDIRPLRVTWKALEAKLGCKISRNTGFPKVSIPSHGSKVIDELLKQTGVIEHLFEWPGLEARGSEHEGASTSTPADEAEDESASTSTTNSEEHGFEPTAKRQKLWNHVV